MSKKRFTIISFKPVRNDEGLFWGFQLHEADWDLMLTELEFILEGHPIPVQLKKPATIYLDQQKIIEIPYYAWDKITEQFDKRIFEKLQKYPQISKDIFDLYNLVCLFTADGCQPTKKKVGAQKEDTSHTKIIHIDINASWIPDSLRRKLKKYTGKSFEFRLSDLERKVLRKKNETDWCPLFSQLPNYNSLVRICGRNHVFDPAKESLQIIMHSREKWDVYKGDQIPKIKGTFPTNKLSSDVPYFKYESLSGNSFHYKKVFYSIDRLNIAREIYQAPLWLANQCANSIDDIIEKIKLFLTKEICSSVSLEMILSIVAIKHARQAFCAFVESGPSSNDGLLLLAEANKINEFINKKIHEERITESRHEICYLKAEAERALDKSKSLENKDSLIMAHIKEILSGGKNTGFALLLDYINILETKGVKFNFDSGNPPDWPKDKKKSELKKDAINELQKKNQTTLAGSKAKAICRAIDKLKMKFPASSFKNFFPSDPDR